MAAPSEKLAESLEVLRKLQAEGAVALRSAQLSRTHRERLLKAGFIKEALKGWYVPARPDETLGESTSWYAAFWPFCAAYLNHVKGDDWCLSPEQSIAIHAENMSVPKQLLVRATKARNNITVLPHDTSLLDIRSTLPDPSQLVVKDGLRLYSLPAALIACSKQSFSLSPLDMRAALAMIRDASEILPQLLEGGHSVIAGRLAGAFRNIDKDQIADDICHAMSAAGYVLRESDPFATKPSLSFAQRVQSPYVHRIRLMWQQMRETVIAHFPKPPRKPIDPKAYLKHIEEVYVTDAYHSLSIEGYRVTPAIIERVRLGDWSPEHDAADQQGLTALSARGYWQAYQAVRQSIESILKAGDKSGSAGTIVEKDHGEWYRQMFAPGVTAGIYSPADLAGYRNAPVFIRHSKHAPPSKDAVRDVMPAFFELLKAEDQPSVRVVLGHFVFVYIHPYMDGNGRMGRFLMNAMLASGGYPWTVVPLTKRSEYMAALEQASTNHDIEPFTKFLASLMEAP